MMLSLLLLPFRIVGAILHGVLSFVGGVIGAVFGLLGGLVSLAWNLLAVGLIVGLIVAVFSRKSRRETYSVDGEKFTSYYNHK